MNPPAFPDFISHELSKRVFKKDTAARYGSGLVEVFATPAMIALMEKTCHLAVAPFLENGHTTVGTEVKVSHLRATLLHALVKCRCNMLSRTGNKIEFEIMAFDENGLIGEGTHTRYVVEMSRFMARLK